MYNFRDWRFYLGAAITVVVMAAVWGFLWTFTYFPTEPQFARAEDEDIEELKRLASGGDTDAMYALVHYFAGEDFDSGAVLKWLIPASNAGHAGAQNELGNAYLLGWFGLSKNQQQACEWYIKSAEGGEPVGQFNASYCFRDGIGVERNDQKASKLAFQSARTGYGASQIVTYFRYKEGIGVERNRWISALALRSAYRNEESIETIVRFELTWQDQSIDAFGVIGSSYRYVRLAGGDWAVALRQMALDAEQNRVEGNESSCETLSNPTYQLNCWLSGGGEKIDWTDTSLQQALWLAAAQLGDDKAQQQVAERYRTGRLFSQNASEAEYWRRRASAQQP